MTTSFPAKFGSIAGESALKFGFYWRQETGAWMTGSPLKQVELSPANANRSCQETARSNSLLPRTYWKSSPKTLPTQTTWNTEPDGPESTGCQRLRLGPQVT